MRSIQGTMFCNDFAMMRMEQGDIVLEGRSVETYWLWIARVVRRVWYRFSQGILL